MSENVKFVRKNGTDFYTGIIKHEVGKVITAPDWNPEPYCGGGLHFGEARVGMFSVPGIPGRAFKVEPIGEVVEISEGKKKAQSLKIVEELDFPKLLSELTKDKSWSIRAAVAVNPNATEKMLSELAKDENWYVRAMVAANPNATKKMLSELAKDENVDVKIKVAANPNTIKEALSEFAKDENPNPYVRITAIRNLKDRGVGPLI